MLGELPSHHEKPPLTPEDNFKHWKSVVGLPEAFPKLPPINDNWDRFHAGVVHRAVIEKIVTTGSPLRVAVAPGQGCTTLARYVHHELDQLSLTARTIPIFIPSRETPSTEPPWQDLFGEDMLEDRVRYGVAHFLATKPVWYTVGTKKYVTMLKGKDAARGHQSLRNAHDAQSELDILVRQFDQSKMISQDQVKAREDFLPDLNQAVEILLKKEEDKVSGRQYRLTFVVDLSSKFAHPEHKDNQPIFSHTEFASSIRKKVGRFQEKHPEAGVDEVYFADSSTLASIFLESGFAGDQRESWDIEYPPYSPADVFAILTKHYQPEAGHLATVVDPQLLEQFVGPNRTLAQVIDDFNGALKQRMQSFESIPYRIRL